MIGHAARPESNHHAPHKAPRRAPDHHPARTGPPGLRARLQGRPAVAATVLCGATALVVSLVSADWTVQDGDTLYSIAQRTGSTIDAIVAANDIPNPDLIFTGQVFQIPTGSTNSSSTNSSKAASGSDDATGSDDAGADQGSEAAPSVTTVRAGESTASVARRLDISVEALLDANGYPNVPLMTGRRVRATAPPPPSAGGSGPATHTVSAGETLEGIAGQYGLSWRKIARANDLANPNLITAGSELSLPGRGGGMGCPVDGAVSFANDFAIPKPGEDRFHEGIDIHAARGTPVVAPVSGVVEHVTGTRGGLQYHLYGDDGYRYWGTHLDELGASGRVEAGQVLGTVGDTGNAVGGPTHLHFEVYRDGISVNSYPTLAKVC